MKINIKAWRSKNDPEKCVTPAILFVSGPKEPAFLIAVGWWDFAFGFFVYYGRPEYQAEREG